MAKDFITLRDFEVGDFHVDEVRATRQSELKYYYPATRDDPECAEYDFYNYEIENLEGYNVNIEEGVEYIPTEEDYNAVLNYLQTECEYDSEWG